MNRALVRSRRGLARLTLGLGVVFACAGGTPPLETSGPHPVGQPVQQQALSAPSSSQSGLDELRPDQATLVRPLNVYASTMSGRLSPAAEGIPERVYVPNSDSGTVYVIDPATMEVTDRFSVGQIPHHVAPAWDLRELYVDNEGSSSLTVIDPRSGKPVRTIPVNYPYNLYFTPDGTKAINVAERIQRLEFRDPHTWQVIKSVPIPYAGVDHMDFTADGRYLLASTEWAGVLVKVDVEAMEVVGTLNVGGLPVDVRLSPDGSVFFVANQGRHGVSVVDWQSMKELTFIPTGRGAHGFQVSRDAKSLYVSNRLEGSISMIDFESRQVTGTWRIGGSPDMMQLNPDGKRLWVSGRFHSAVYVVDTGTGQLVKTIRVGAQPHGLTYFPGPGDHSTGHNGVYR